MSSDRPSPETAAGPRAIVAGHGEFAPGLVSAVQLITGRGDQLVPLVVRDLGLTEIQSLIQETMVAANVQVVFTDLQAGSCTMAARRVLRGLDDALLIAGANLPMLLDFVLATGRTPMDAARHAVERGRAAITIHGGSGVAG
jgi:PTS system N-acetylgalactosamine-specific IIA component